MNYKLCQKFMFELLFLFFRVLSLFITNEQNKIIENKIPKELLGAVNGSFIYISANIFETH